MGKQLTSRLDIKMKYATLDKNKPIAFYSEEIHGELLIPDPAHTDMKTPAPMIPNPNSQIPKNAVQMPHAIWQRHIDGTKQVYDAATKSWSDYVPTKVEVLATTKATTLGQIKTDYQTALDSGVTYSGALFQSDAKSIATLSETLTAIANGWTLPTGFSWIDAANASHPANTAFLKGLSTALANHKAALFARLQTAKTTITAEGCSIND